MGFAEKAVASSPAASLGTIEANGVAMTFRKVSSAFSSVNSTVVGSTTLMPVAVVALPLSTSAAPTMLPKKPDATGDGFGFSLGLRTRLIEYATSSAVIGQ